MAVLRNKSDDPRDREIARETVANNLRNPWKRPLINFAARLAEHAGLYTLGAGLCEMTCDFERSAKLVRKAGDGDMVNLYTELTDLLKG